jgi:hypothetical protein
MPRGFQLPRLRATISRAWATHAAANRHPRGSALGVNWLSGFDFEIKVIPPIPNGKRLIGFEGARIGNYQSLLPRNAL